MMVMQRTQAPWLQQDRHLGLLDRWTVLPLVQMERRLL